MMASLWSDSDSDDCLILETAPLSSTTSTTKQNLLHVNTSTSKKANQWVASSFDGFGDIGQDEITEPVKSKSFPQKSKTSIGRERTVPGKRPYQSIDDAFKKSQNGFVKKDSVSRRATKLPETDLWSDKYAPKTQTELAVHKKKLADVEGWIKNHLTAQKNVPPMLLLTGPAGAGKTATVQVLARELGCELHEWTNPIADSYVADNTDWRSRSKLDIASSRGSQQSQFQDFLLRANKYNTLDIFGGGGGTRKIIFVEDFPNIFYRDAAPFHEILRKYVQVGGSPLIFIVSDSSRGESNERRLFPKDLQQQLCIENISFNPVAMTSMTKILTRIATQESLQGSHKFTVPSKNVIESIAMASSGDIRGSINALQFACLKDTCDLTMPSVSKGKSTRSSKQASTTSKRSRAAKPSDTTSTSATSQEDGLASIGGRDTSIFLFRALGKVLYCKRDEPSADKDVPVLPRHLAHHYRDPLQFDPEDVVEKCHLSGDFFSAYLHQNYVDFYSSIEDVVCASECLSDADYLTIDWASRSALQQYAASVATRGILHSNTSRARHSEGGGGLGWKPLHKPQWYSVLKSAQQNCDSARSLFKSYRSPPEVLQTEIIPYISLINTTLHDTGQIAIMQELCKFSSHRPMERSAKLDEKDVDMDDADYDVTNSTNHCTQSTQLPRDTDDVMPSSQSNVKASQEEEEEEFEIEDYDDD